MNTALLLIAHGSRRAEANADAHTMAELLTARGPSPCLAAFLELASPTIPEGARQCLDRGASRIVLLPFFLSAGMHVTRDLQDWCVRLGQEYPQIQFLLAPPIGCHPLVVEVLAHQAAQALVSSR